MTENIMQPATPGTNSLEGSANKEIVIDPKQHILIEMSSDMMKLYVKFLKPEAGSFQPTKQDVMDALKRENVVYGINEESVEKLVKRPIFNIKIQIGEGTPAESGKDGFVEFFVAKDAEYKPEVDEDDTIDFKNLNYFQMVKEGQMLCAITPPEPGKAGQDVLGREIVASEGKPAKSPQGKNTSFNEDGSVLFADCDGIINFTKDVVNVNDVLRIKADVDTSTGNIDFPGDVIVDGDVCEGFSIKSGGNVIIKGVVESANIEAAGDIQIVRGINGGDNTSITVGGNFRCLYIEHAKVSVKGDILAESIVESDITCDGDIDLTSSGKGVLVGGNTSVMGELRVKTLGNESERVTNIRVIGVETGVEEEKRKCISAKDDCTKKLERFKNERRKYYNPIKGEENPYEDELRKYDAAIEQTQKKLDEVVAKLAELNQTSMFEYRGSVVCKGKLYYGTRIYFGEQRYQFNSDSLDHCRILWNEGEILNVTL